MPSFPPMPQAAARRMPAQRFLGSDQRRQSGSLGGRSGVGIFLLVVKKEGSPMPRIK